MDTPGKINWKDGKPMLSLIPYKGLEFEARALMFGLVKHGHDSWKALGSSPELFLDAALRHLNKYASGEKIDPETGLSHIAHCKANLGFLAHFEGAE